MSKRARAEPVNGFGTRVMSYTACHSSALEKQIGITVHPFAPAAGPP